jgi:hypothetical protein
MKSNYFYRHYFTVSTFIVFICSLTRLLHFYSILHIAICLPFPFFCINLSLRSNILVHVKIYRHFAAVILHDFSRFEFCKTMYFIGICTKLIFYEIITITGNINKGAVVTEIDNSTRTQHHGKLLHPLPSIPQSNTSNSRKNRY